jgi:CheY-like chemotaxis protein
MSEKPKLLIAEDDPDVRKALERILRGTFTVILTQDGKQGAEKFLTDPDIRLVMSDGDMPFSNGAMFHASIVDELKRRGGRFFLITAGIRDETILAYFRKYPVPILHKPFDADELRRKLLKTWRGLPTL